MGRAIDELARFAAETRCEDIPEPVRRHARLVLLDTLGVILAGAGRPEVARLRDRLAATAGSGATVYAAGWPTHDPRGAALYLLRPGDVPVGQDASAYYSRGVVVY